MAIQFRQNNNNEPFVLDDTAEVVTDLTLALSTSAASITKGCALGVVNTTAGGLPIGQLVPTIGTATDGSQVTKYLLADDTVVLATTAGQTVSGYSRGLFDENQVSFGNTATTLATEIPFSASSGTASSIADIMRTYNLRLAPGISASGFENA